MSQIPALRDFHENKRYSILTVYLLHLTHELTDTATFIIAMF